MLIKNLLLKIILYIFIFSILIFYIFYKEAISKNYLIPEENEKYSGGKGTIFNFNNNAFSKQMKNISFEERMDFAIGNGFFKRIWVSSPASTKASDGLGPLFNSRSCQRCHLKDGRGHPPEFNFPEDDAVSMVLHLSIPPRNDEEISMLNNLTLKAIPDPIYGSQLSDFSIQGIPAEGNLHIIYEEQEVKFKDGEVVYLRKPNYSIKNLQFGDLHEEIQLSARVAQPMFGLGLLESISEDDIRKNADPNDENQDGISGKANLVLNYQTISIDLGRFGWKATNPTIYQQSAEAANQDMGLSNSLFHNPDNCTDLQEQCKKMPNGNTEMHNNFELSNEQLDLMVFYAKHLAVPGRREHDDFEVLKGKEIFFNSGCNSCHVQKFTTQNIPGDKALSNQLIWPFTDLLLHDMGEGLADNNKEFLAEGNEWRTPPLWGLGMTKKVNKHTFLLHDGRARNIMEAILWHGGEAEHSKNIILSLNKKDRDYLIKFLESL